MNTSLQIANYFVEKSINFGVELTPMKLVKLTYIAHGWYLALADSPLINEAVEAWKYGPVVPSVYQHFKKYKNQQITALEFDCNLNQIPNIEEENLKLFLNKIWEVYKDFNGLQLSTLTHQPNTPWDIIWNQSGVRKNEHQIIPNEIIKNHYLEKI